jgi:hypothetical protein
VARLFCLLADAMGVVPYSVEWAHQSVAWH